MFKKRLSWNHELIAVFVISIFMFCIGVNRGGTQLVIAEITELFNIGTEGIGLLTAMQQIPPLFLPFLMGIVADRIGKKPVAISFVVVFAIGCFICCGAGSLGVFIIGTLIYKSGSTVSENILTAVLADLNREKGMQYINLSQFMFSLGAAAGPVYFQSLHYQWQSVFSFSALLFAIMSLIMIPVRFPIAHKDSSVSSSTDHSSTLNHFGRRFRVTPILIALALSMFCIISMETGYGNFLEAFVYNKLQDKTISAFSLSAFWIGMAISRLIFSFIQYDAVQSLKICFASAAVFMFSLVFLKNPTLIVIVSGIVGFSYGPTWCTINALAAANSSGNSGTAVGMMSIASGVGGILIPTVMGIISSRSSLSSAIVVLAVIAAIGSFTSFVIRKQMIRAESE